MVWMVVFAIGHDQRLCTVKGKRSVRFIRLDDENRPPVFGSLATSHTEGTRLAANGPFDPFAKGEQELGRICGCGGLAVGTADGDGIAVAHDLRQNLAAEHDASRSGDYFGIVARYGRSRYHKVCIGDMVGGMSEKDAHALRLQPGRPGRRLEVAPRHLVSAILQQDRQRGHADAANAYKMYLHGLFANAAAKAPSTPVSKGMDSLASKRENSGCLERNASI